MANKPVSLTKQAETATESGEMLSGKCVRIASLHVPMNKVGEKIPPARKNFFGEQTIVRAAGTHVTDPAVQQLGWLAN